MKHDSAMLPEQEELQGSVDIETKENEIQKRIIPPRPKRRHRKRKFIAGLLASHPWDGAFVFWASPKRDHLHLSNSFGYLSLIVFLIHRNADQCSTAYFTCAHYSSDLFL